jgi:hypothetical protein
VEKVDLKKTMKHLYAPSKKEVVEVEVPKLNFLMVDGEGDPNNSKAYGAAAEALFSLSYALKFAIKNDGEGDYGVMPLEGLWWVEGEVESYEELQSNRAAWRWTAMIMQPRWVTRERFEEAKRQVGDRKALPALPATRFEILHEGRAAQILHIGGPITEEGPTVEKLHRYIADRGGEERGKHHEIYLSDFTRTAPEKLKTVIRQPFA